MHCYQRMGDHSEEAEGAVQCPWWNTCVGNETNHGLCPSLSRRLTNERIKWTKAQHQMQKHAPEKHSFFKFGQVVCERISSSTLEHFRHIPQVVHTNKKVLLAPRCDSTTYCTSPCNVTTKRSHKDWHSLQLLLQSWQMDNAKPGVTYGNMNKHGTGGW